MHLCSVCEESQGGEPPPGCLGLESDAYASAVTLIIKWKEAKMFLVTAEPMQGHAALFLTAYFLIRLQCQQLLQMDPTNLFPLSDDCFNEAHCKTVPVWIQVWTLLDGWMMGGRMGDSDVQSTGI